MFLVVRMALKIALSIVPHLTLSYLVVFILTVLILAILLSTYQL